MFGLFKRRIAPADPVVMLWEIDIARPPEEVFALIDLADPGNRQIAMGHRVDEVAQDDYFLTLSFAPGEPFRIKVIERRAPGLYAIGTRLATSMGALDSLDETYALTPHGENGTRVSLKSSARFYPGLSWNRYGKELCYVSVACMNELRKLKLHAEQGEEAARAVMLETDTARLDSLLAETA